MAEAEKRLPPFSVTVDMTGSDWCPERKSFLESAVQFAYNGPAVNADLAQLVEQLIRNE